MVDQWLIMVNHGKFMIQCGDDNWVYHIETLLTWEDLPEIHLNIAGKDATGNPCKSSHKPKMQE
jgi:hypothetical protein